MQEKLKNSTKITTRIIWKCGINYLGRNVLDVMKKDQIDKFTAEKGKKAKKEKAYLGMNYESDALITTGKAIKQFNQKDLITIMKLFKHPDDKTLSKKGMT